MSALPRAKSGGRPVSYASVVMVLAIAAQAGVAIGAQGIPVICVFVQRDFGLTRTELGLLVAVAQASSCTGMLFGGWLCDVLGVRRVGTLGVGLIAAALLGLTTAGSYGAALPFVLIAGAGNGLGFPAITLAILHWLPVHARSTAMGLKQTGATMAATALAAGYTPLAEHLGWRPAVVVVAAIVLLLAGSWLLIYRNAPQTPSPRQRPSPFGGFRLLGQPAFLMLSLFATAAVAAQFSLLSYLMLFLHEQRGFSIVLAGQVLAAVQLGAIVGRVGWGVVSDRLMQGARKPVMCMAGGSGALALAALVAVPRDPLLVALLVAFLLGLTLLAWQGVFQVAAAELAGPERSAQAISASMMMLQLGAMVGPPLIGLLLDHTKSYELGWLVLAAAVILGVVGMLAAWRERRPQRG